MNAFFQTDACICLWEFDRAPRSLLSSRVFFFNPWHAVARVLKARSNRLHRFRQPQPFQGRRIVEQGNDRDEKRCTQTHTHTHIHTDRQRLPDSCFEGCLAVCHRFVMGCQMRTGFVACSHSLHDPLVFSDESCARCNEATAPRLKVKKTSSSVG